MLCIVCFEGPKIIHICEPLSYSKEGMEMEELMELIVFIWIPRPPNRNVEILLLRPVPHPRSHIKFPIRVFQKTQKSEFWNVTYPNGFHRLD